MPDVRDRFDAVRFQRAAVRQEMARRAMPHPVPARITMALDLRGLYGPEVDHACGVAEPAVDEWEAGTRIPSREQVALLAALTDFPVAFFYHPMAAEPLTGFWVCTRRGCERVDMPAPILQPKPGAPVGGREWYGTPGLF